jgi:hypothetical protein
LTLVVFDDGVGDGEAQSRAFVGFFGGKKRAENSVVMIWWDAWAIVGYANDDCTGFLLGWGSGLYCWRWQ